MPPFIRGSMDVGVSNEEGQNARGGREKKRIAPQHTDFRRENFRISGR
jgi:hypothetical protein